MHEFIPCFNTSTIRPAPLMDKIRLAGEAGFRQIELWNDDVTAYLQGGGSMDEIRRALRETGLTVPSVIAVLGWIGCADAERDERRAEAVRRMEQAKALGSPFIVATPPRGQVDLERAGRDYHELLEIGRRIGVRPMMEFLGFVEHVNNINTTREIVERANDSTGTIVIDFFHMVRGQQTTLEDLRALPVDRIGIVHLDDVPYTKPFSEMTDADRVYPGDGDIPLGEMMETLRSMSYRGPVSLELFNRAYWEQDPAQVVTTGFEKSQPFFR
jgi:2-keto-myo-inositol isomerase